MRSIRRRLTLGLFLSLSLLIAICGAILYGTLKTLLTRQFESTLLARARALAALVQQAPDGRVVFDLTGDLPSAFERHAVPEYYEIWLENGAVLRRSRSLSKNDLPQRGGSLEKPHWSGHTLPDGDRVRTVGFYFTPQPEPVKSAGVRGVRPRGRRQRALLIMARSRQELDHTLDSLLLVIGGTGLALPVGIALIVQLLVKEGLRPLGRVGAEAAAIDSRNLQHRFPTAEMPLELQPICQKLNELLGRIEEAFARERRFTGDVAHELRTPIAELHSLTEVALMCADDEQLSQSTIREALTISRQMDRLIRALLALARCEAGMQTMTREPLELGAALRQAWAPYQERAAKRALTCAWEVAESLPIQTDRAMLESALGNLFSNAVDHSAGGGRIRIEARAEKEAIELVIANSQTGLNEADLTHMLEPFWQKDAARTDSAHSGLGLSLVAAFCRLMEVKLELGLGEGDFTASLSFPATQDKCGVRSVECGIIKS